MKCGKTFDISNFSNFKNDKYSPEDYCKDCEKLIAIAKDLDELIDIYGFGTEFSAEDLYKYFENEIIANSKIKLLIEHGLLIKNKLTGNYHFSDIVTCNNFIKENYVNNKKLLNRLDLLDSSPINYWTENLPIINKKIQEISKNKQTLLKKGN